MENQELLVIEFEKKFGQIVDNAYHNDLDLRGYEHPLPASITQTGYLDLRGYEHPLPASIKCSSIKIDNTGPWGIEINLRKISIGCKTKYTDGWKEFFKNKSFYETSPSSEQYQFIVNLSLIHI